MKKLVLTLIIIVCFLTTSFNCFAYSDGDKVSVDTRMLSKNYCENYGKYKKEVYTHAVLYYGAVPIDKIYNLKVKVGPINIKLGTLNLFASSINYIKNHSNPIDLGNDNATRRIVFDVIWSYPR